MKPSTVWRALIITFLIGAVFVLVVAFLTWKPRPTKAKTAILQISGAKGSLGMTITNREPRAISQCEVTLLERGRGDEWIATLVGIVTPMGSMEVPWEQFRHASSRSALPSYIGRDAKYFTVSCVDHTGTRRGGGLAFRE